MKRIQLYIVAVVTAFGVSATAQDNAPANESLILERSTSTSKNQQTIGPGKVRLAVSRGGRWVEFSAASSNKKSLINGGGIFLYVSNGDGNPSEVMNAASGNLQVRTGLDAVAKCHEGMTGGSRAPSPAPDDDNDGLIDEDRLDGADNDNDGAIDEDFAAIGDEMIVAEYATAGTGHRLLVHHEAYAWSLPHIDGTIMMSVLVKNTGTDPIEDVRIGAFFDKEGAFTFSKRSVRTAAPLTGEETSGRLLVCSQNGEPELGIILFPTGDRFGMDWITGLAPSASDIRDEVVSRVISGENDVLIDETPIGTLGLPVPRFNSMEDQRVEAGSSVYFLSPAAGAMAPGEEIRIDMALIAVPVSASMDQAAEVALKTYLGDGVNRYLPPPMSMTPRVIWGSYRTNDAGSGIVIEFEALGDDPVTAEQVSYFNGIDENQLDREEVVTGGMRLVLRTEAADKAVANGDRITLKGRLESGEFFEVILRPVDVDNGTSVVRSGEADQYFRTEGKLGDELLKGSPNPFRNSTTIFYAVPSVIEREDGEQMQTGGPYETSVKVYNVVGRLVARLADEQMMPGGYAIEWSAVDEIGNPVASGVYYVKLQIEKRYITKRFILLK